MVDNGDYHDQSELQSSGKSNKQSSITSASKTTVRGRPSPSAKQQRFQNGENYQTPTAPVRTNDMGRSNGDSDDETNSAGRLTNTKRKAFQNGNKFYPSEDSSADEKQNN
jgi:hypothetical protein